jgi:excinuclease ABC subunit A
MHFLPDVYVTCDVCRGRRYNRDTLEILFKGKSIADVLDMTVEEAATFFKAVPTIREKMTTLERVGLGYVKVGQQATTLSGGEAQRVKLSKELSRRATGRTLYILDEPTTGLHFEDTRKLLEVLHELVEQGNTVVVIEHNLDVIKTADWLLDFGPEGGDGGGRIVAAGTPEQVAADAESWTGRYLADVLKRHETGGWRGWPSSLENGSGRRLFGPLAPPPDHGAGEEEIDHEPDGGFGDVFRAQRRVGDGLQQPVGVHP